MVVSSSFWGVQGWDCQNTTTGGDSRACFNFFSPSGTIHHLIFANNIARNSAGGFTAGSNGSFGSDYIAIVGNLAINAATTNTNCTSNIGVFEPLALDAAAGTHIFIAGNYSILSKNPSGCADGEGINIDTLDWRTSSSPHPYSAQIVVDNNLVLSNGGPGILAEYSAGTSPAKVILRHNTAWGNSSDANQAGSNGQTCAEMMLFQVQNAQMTYNLANTSQAYCYGSTNSPQLAAIAVGGVDASDLVDHNFGFSATGTHSRIGAASTGFAYDASNVFGQNPVLTGPAVPTDPDCSTAADVPHCMAPTLAAFQPTLTAAKTSGVQPVSTTPIYDPLYPAWLATTTNMPAALVTPGGASAPSTPAVSSTEARLSTNSIPVGGTLTVTPIAHLTDGSERACAPQSTGFVGYALVPGTGNASINIGASPVVVTGTSPGSIGVHVVCENPAVTSPDTPATVTGAPSIPLVTNQNVIMQNVIRQ